MIILEGPDCAGKTTLAEAVLRDYWGISRHQGPFHGSEPVMNQVVDAVLRGGSAVRVFDRLYHGERVYGPIYRGEDRLGAAHQRMLDRFMLTRDAVLVKCIAPWSVMKDLWLKRADDERFASDGVDKYVKVWTEYGHLTTFLPTINWDFTKDNPRELIGRIHEAKRGYNAQAIQTGVGSWRPGISTLIVGEAPGKWLMDKYKVPLTFIAPNGNGPWFAEKLKRWGIDERELFWVNAKTVDGKTQDAGFLDDLQPKRIIALGERAKLWAQLNGEQPEAYPHPAYWKRFHHNEPYPLAQAFGDTAWAKEVGSF